MKDIHINVYFQAIQDEIMLVASTVTAKGVNRFYRALVLAMVLPFAAYILLYAPARRKLSTLDADLQTARDTAKNAATYKEFKDRLAAAYVQLPLPNDRTEWLSDTVKEALHAEGIVPIRFMPPSEDESNNAVIQTINLTMVVKFSEMMLFLARLEAIRPAVYVTSLNITKKSSASEIGQNDVSCGISTIILTERY